METFAMIITNLLLALIFLILGFIVRKGKAKILLGTYILMSKSGQEQLDINKLNRFTARLYFVSSLILLLGCIPVLFDFYPIISIFASCGAFAVIMLWGMTYRIKSPRFKSRN